MNHKVKEQKILLAADASTALHELIGLTRALIDLSVQEEQALVTNDMIQLSMLQDQKEKLAWQYAQGSREFRARIEEFRSVDKTMLAELEKLQVELGKATKDNNVLIQQIHQSARNNTQNTLLTVQELGQPVHIQNNQQTEHQEGA